MIQSHLAILYRAFIVLFLLIASLFLLYISFSYIYPFYLALIISLVIHPIVELLEKRTMFPRSINVALVLLFFLLAGIGLMSLFIAEIISGTAYLADFLPTQFNRIYLIWERIFSDKIIPLYNQSMKFFYGLESGQQESLIRQFDRFSEQALSNSGTFISRVLESIPLMITSIPGTATAVVFSLLGTFFISKDWYKLKDIMTKAIPKQVIDSGEAVAAELKKAFNGFIKAQLQLIGITFLIVLMGFFLIRLEHAVTVALLIAIVDLLPYLGTGFVFVPWTIYLVLSDQLPLAIGISIIYIAVLIIRQFMEPKILSKSIGLDPLATLIALFAGFRLFGFLGLIIGPVILVILQTLINTGVAYEIWQYVASGKKK
ncbi:sporulation integral membrane protein YtvI [Bacillus gobiensis]|uniref:sporulation integral membrane protein YtvI n=1 Tax=Bacillus gobiensis TaxID=1441095 RepID=UPI003D1B5C6A